MDLFGKWTLFDTNVVFIPGLCKKVHKICAKTSYIPHSMIESEVDTYNNNDVFSSKQLRHRQFL